MKVKINDKAVAARAGQTILELAREEGITIPSLCYHPDLEVKANCRICVVELKGQAKLAAACLTPVKEGMEIYTDSPKVKAARALNLELILAEHTKKCSDCVALFDCELLRLVKEYKIPSGRLAERKKARKTQRFGVAVEIDHSQCIDCQNCVSACEKQGIDYLKMAGTGKDQEVSTAKEKDNKACVYCGQCALHCPVSSAQEQLAWPAVEKALKDKSRIVIAQYAPAVRVSIGEEFGLPAGTNCEENIRAAIQKLGFNFSTDINFAADITTLVEAEELAERLSDKKAVWPMMTSCCPAWVAYVESRYRGLKPNLTTARSPHIYSAQVIKTYWAKQQGINPKKIVVVSIVPCTAKKQEAVRPENYWKGRPLVDHVLTTREFAYLIKRQHLDLKNLGALKDSKNKDNFIFNNGSGAAAIYGASGGVMESALRTAAFLLEKDKKGKMPAKRLEFKEVRGLKGIKETEINIAGRRLKIGVVNGLGNFHRLLPKLKKYHYIEVMACPGGCLGGGGQPLPTTEAIRQKRLAGLYEIDKQRLIRQAHKNQAAIAYCRSAKLIKF